MEEVIITDHAFDKIKERMGFKKKVAIKMTKMAIEKGLSHKDTKGRLNKYITSLWGYNKNANNIKIYGHYIFIFSGNTLITVYLLPNNLKKLM